MLTFILLQLFCLQLASSLPIFHANNNNTIVIGDEQYEIVDDDILVKKEQFPFRTSDKTRRPWPNGRVPYIIDPAANYSIAQYTMIRESMDRIEKQTSSCLKFVQYANETAYIKIKNTKNACNSPIGKAVRDQEQSVLLGNACLNKKGEVVHKLLHTVGMIHEHNRPDRDYYIKINLDNVRQNKKDIFKIYDSAKVDTFGQSYDYYSIMHYSQYAFNQSGKPTFEALKKDIDMSKVGFSEFLSPADIYKVKAYYGCMVESKRLKNVATGLYLDSNENGKVYTLANNDGNYQVWLFERTGEENIFFVSNYQTGKYLDTDFNGDVYTREFNGGNHQKWKVDGLRLVNVATRKALYSDTFGYVSTFIFFNTGNSQEWSRQ